MPSKLPYYKMYPADFDGDEKARVLTLAEKGLYLECMNHAWQNGGSIPKDDIALARAVHVSVNMLRRFWKRVGKCFQDHPTDPSRLVNPRQWKEYCKAQDTSSERSEAGKKGAAASHAAGNCQSVADIRAFESVSEPAFENSEEQKTSLRAREKTPAERRAENGITDFDFPAWFEECWARWKKRRGNQKQLCAQYLGELAISQDFIWHFHNGLVRWCTHWDKRGWTFCTQTLVEWVRDEGWKDEPVEASATVGISRNEQAMRIAYEEQLRAGAA